MKKLVLVSLLLVSIAALPVSAQPSANQTLQHTYRYVAPQPILRSIWSAFLNFNFFAS